MLSLVHFGEKIASEWYAWYGFTIDMEISFAVLAANAVMFAYLLCDDLLLNEGDFKCYDR